MDQLVDVSELENESTGTALERLDQGPDLLDAGVDQDRDLGLLDPKLSDQVQAASVSELDVDDGHIWLLLTKELDGAANRPRRPYGLDAAALQEDFQSTSQSVVSIHQGDLHPVPAYHMTRHESTSNLPDLRYAATPSPRRYTV